MAFPTRINAMPFRNLVLVGVLTWVLVGVQHVVRGVRSGFLATGPGLLWSACFVVFLVCFLLATRERCDAGPRLLLIGVQSVLALVCMSLHPDWILAVLLVMVAGQLGSLATPAMIAFVAAQSAVLALLEYSRGNEWIPITAAYFTFQLFGAFTARVAQDERRAKQALAQVNAELRVATGLLDLSSRSEERLRISRDLHDLIGHHLTALSLNLEVASHLAEGRALEQIEKSQALTKLLLSDVRDVVSRLRDDESIDLGAALRAIRDAVPSPVVQIDADDFVLHDAAVARTLLRAVQEAVTNAVRHSGAKNLFITLRHLDGSISLDARDDGAGTDVIRLGNGLQGMRERVESAGGTFEARSERGRGFEVQIRLPPSDAAQRTNP